MAQVSLFSLCFLDKKASCWISAEIIRDNLKWSLDLTIYHTRSNGLSPHNGLFHLLPSLATSANWALKLYRTALFRTRNLSVFKRKLLGLSANNVDRVQTEFNHRHHIKTFFCLNWPHLRLNDTLVL